MIVPTENVILWEKWAKHLTNVEDVSKAVQEGLAPTAIAKLTQKNIGKWMKEANLSWMAKIQLTEIFQDLRNKRRKEKEDLDQMEYPKGY